MRCGRVWVQVLSITLAIEASYASQRHVCRERGRRAHRQASGKATTRRARPEARRELKDPYSLCEALPHAARRLAASRRPQGHRRQGTAPTHVTARIFLTHQDRNDRVEMYYELYGTGPEKVLLIMGVLPFPLLDYSGRGLTRSSGFATPCSAWHRTVAALMPQLPNHQFLIADNRGA